LRTSYFKLHINTKPPEDVKKFAAITWEVLNILKENFPSHLHLYQENLECCEPFYKPMNPKEELRYFFKITVMKRRQLSCLLSKQDSSKTLLQEEIDDVWYLLEACYRVKEIKGITTCLEILDSANHCPEPILKQNAEEQNIKLLNEIIGNEEMLEADTATEINKTLAKKILLKIKNGVLYEKAQPVLGDKDMNKFTQENTSIQQNEEIDVSLTKSFDQPPSLRVCIFQLSESNDLERVTFILQSIAKYPKTDLVSLKKSGINSKIIKVIQKYCNGDYGFDQDIAKLGSFQYCIIKCLIVLSDTFLDFVEFLQNGVFSMLGQICEEAIIYIYDKTINSCMEWNSKLPKFLSESLSFFELGINLKCSKQYEEMRGVYQMLKKRLTGMSPQEVNIEKIFKTFFPEKATGDIIEKSEDSSSDLKVLCPILYNTLLKVEELLVKLEALKEYSETHQEKYQKLFTSGVAVGAVPANDKKYNTMISPDPKDLSTATMLEKKLIL